ncbi:hypothetical protein GIB67_038593 [Kingdonia uniflora]|uniref:Uncharacterized protein n=1 Tax=Kingdonia uniflora TaxID=39325 RepID=A0A7J7NPJ8_9MAGN|nr:hypothetical protein GIB67_038593 [Kingdonia uniflora]
MVSSVDEVQINVNDVTESERQSQPVESLQSTKRSRKGKVTSEVNAPHGSVDRNPNTRPNSQDLNAADHTEKYKKYEADYVRRLKAKYFSKKDLYGGNIFDKETVIENEVIKSSRWPCTRSFTNPVESFEDRSRSSSSVAENSMNLPNKYQWKKSSS